MAGTGAVIGPVALVWGLQHTSGSSASLMLTLEAVFTAVLAWRWYGETMDKRVIGAVLLMPAGGVVLVIEQGAWGPVQLWGLLAVMLATVAWGVDNTLSRGVADRDPGQVVLVKATLGALCTLFLATGLDEPVPRATTAMGLVAVGAKGLWLELAVLLACATHLRRSTHRLCFCICPFHRGHWRRGFGRPIGEWVDGHRRGSDAAGCSAALGGSACPRAYPRRAGT
jgi:drug/metabolite transporter (DMT)-like permease